MKEKWNRWLPVALMLTLALTRWPGLMPPNFSAVYALAFCAGVYFPGRLAWWLPMGTLLVSDLGLNFYYHYFFHADPTKYSEPIPLFSPYLLGNYAAYFVLIWLGRRFSAKNSWLTLLSGGLVGVLLFYLVTNTVSWLQIAAYPKTFAGWLRALSIGTDGWPQTWQFLRNSLLSGGLFTGLFVVSMKLSALAESPADKEPLAAGDAAEEASEPAESKA